MSRESEAILHETARARELLDELERDAETFDRRIAELRRGGLPSSSMGGSSRGAETPLPLPDRIDQFLLQQRRTRRESVSVALKAIQRAAQAQRSIVETVKDAEKELVQWSCENPACATGLLEPGRRKGECSKCKVHKHRYGLSWPNMPEQATA